MSAAIRSDLCYRFNPKGLWLRAWLNLVRSGWKEPRTTLFAPPGSKFSGARIVHVVRDAHAVASSIRERELKFQEAAIRPRPIWRTSITAGNLFKPISSPGSGLLIDDYQQLQFEELQPSACDARAIGKFSGLHATTDNWPVPRPAFDRHAVRSTSSQTRRDGAALSPPHVPGGPSPNLSLHMHSSSQRIAARSTRSVNDTKFFFARAIGLHGLQTQAQSSRSATAFDPGRAIGKFPTPIAQSFTGWRPTFP